ncbi:endonuclease/exonuclease/phosphatase family protein [Geodermatophilus sp. URMC 62]|uniref:endonuclease/exonuclease/phosphatase family protein n=1 Tax=Geodermatophilus sp. URMC 62 TaxID=3423414 RepID=UPI00406CF768
MTRQLAMRVLTFNVALLVRQIGPYTINEVPYREERLPAIIHKIRASGADVVCLQEVFRREHVAALLGSLSDLYPHVARHDNKAWVGLGHGLLLLSRYPISASAFTEFSASPPRERLVIRRGFLIATLEPPLLAGRALHVANLHTTSGGSFGTEAPIANRFRDRQLRQVHQAVLGRGGPALVCGDYNAGPEASAENYERMLELGYADILGSDRSVGKGEWTTWHPDNALVAGSGFDNSPPQRIDHILLNSEASQLLTLTDAQLLNGEQVLSIDGKALTASDHAGVLLEFALSEPEQGPAPQAVATRVRSNAAIPPGHGHSC